MHQLRDPTCCNKDQRSSVLHIRPGAAKSRNETNKYLKNKYKVSFIYIKLDFHTIVMIMKIKFIIHILRTFNVLEAGDTKMIQKQPLMSWQSKRQRETYKRISCMDKVWEEGDRDTSMIYVVTVRKVQNTSRYTVSFDSPQQFCDKCKFNGRRSWQTG